MIDLLFVVDQTNKKDQRCKKINHNPKKKRTRIPKAKKNCNKNLDAEPFIKLYDSIEVNPTYFSTKNISARRNIMKLNQIINDFFLIDKDENTSVPAYSVEEWKLILFSPQVGELDQNRLMQSLKKGLPDEFRKDIWFQLADLYAVKDRNFQKGIIYEKLKSQRCFQEDKIRSDVDRSFVTEAFFQDNNKEKLQALQRILRAYANFDPEVGYTQGMNFFVGGLLQLVHDEHMRKLNDSGEMDTCRVDYTVESDVFWFLVHIMYEKSWRMLYINGTPKLFELFKAFGDRIKEQLPALHKTVADNPCFQSCFCQYFLTMLIHESPREFAKRVLEIFLVAGEEILLHVLIVILTHYEPQIIVKKNLEDYYHLININLLNVGL